MKFNEKRSLLMKKYFLLFIVLFLNTPATQGAAAREVHPYKGAVNFPRAEYQAYMKRIEKLNPEIHAKLKDYKDIFHEPAFLKAADLKSATVLIPTQKSHGQPMMVLPSLISDKELERYLASYKALTKRFIPGKYDFPDAEYQHYMEILQEINPPVYKSLFKHELKTGKRKLLNTLHLGEYVLFPDNSTSGTYEVYIKSMLTKTEDEQKTHLKRLFKEYDESNESDDAELPESKAARYDEKPRDEYEEYMKLIADIDHSVYEKFKEYEKSPGHYPKIINLPPYPALDPVNGITISPEAMIIPPHESNKWNPIIIMTPMHDLSKAQKIENLTHIIKKFCEAVSTHAATLPTRFSQDEYEYYMQIIEHLDESVYKDLIACEEKLKEPCLRQGKKSEIIPPSDETHGYPIIILERNFKGCPTKRDYFKPIVQAYKQVLPIPHEERIKVLGIIKGLAPELYAELVTVDPTGIKHIQRISNGPHFACVSPHPEDGLPLLQFKTSNLSFPSEQLRYIVAHELSHYVLDHFNRTLSFHKKLSPENENTLLTLKGKKVTAPFPYNETFTKAASRVQEAEADRFAVMHFGVSVEAGLAYNDFNSSKDYSVNFPEKIDFTLVHPPAKERIRQFLSLRKEVELQKEKNEPKKPIDWDALREKYKKTSKQAVQEAW